MDVYPKLTPNLPLNLPETVHVDPEHWEIALKKIQFSYLWNNVRKDKNYFIGWYSTVIGHPSNKRVESKFMKKIDPGYYSSMPEMAAELNTKILAELKNITLHLDGFDIRFDYDSFSNKSVLTMSHGVSIKMEGLDLAAIEIRGE